MDAQVYTTKGNKAQQITLPEHVFGVAWNNDLVHQVTTSMRANARANTAHTKDRGDVRGGGKKPWRQKGTGRARHGSIRSPLWVGGGVTFGPRNERNYAKKINRKMRVKALFAVLSAKFRAGELIFVDDLAISNGKTKEARDALTGIANSSGVEEVATRKRNAAWVLVPGLTDEQARGFRNIEGVDIDDIAHINPLRLLGYKYVIIARPEESIEVLQNKQNVKRVSAEAQQSA